MTANEIFDLINKHPVFHLATMDGDQPRVRGMLLFRADDTGGFKLLGSACTGAAGFVAFGPLEPETLYYIKLIGGGLQTRELEQP